MGRRSKTQFMPSVPLFLFFFSLKSHLSLAVDNIAPGHSITGNQTIFSNGSTFELGFFRPGESPNYYIGIWYKTISFQGRTAVWVANRDQPIEDPSLSELKLSEDGNLVLLNQHKFQVWSTDLSYDSRNSTVAVLLDTGNLVLRDGSEDSEQSSAIIWQSFNYPTDTLLPGEKLTLSKFTNKTQMFTSWRSSSDPAPGQFSFQISQDPLMERCTFDILWNTNQRNQRIEIRTSQIFIESVTGIEMHKNEHPIYFTIPSASPPFSSRFVIDYLGQINLLTLSETGRWEADPAIESFDQCEARYPCGGFSSCNWQKPPHCTCLPGFQPNSPRDWSLEDWSDGCVRAIPLSCDNSSANSGENDEFEAIPFTKLPPNAEFIAVKNIEDCKLVCLSTCSCSAYGHSNGKCFIWQTDVWNVQQLTTDDDIVAGHIYVRLHIPKHNKIKMSKHLGLIVFAVSGVLFLSAFALIFLWSRKRCLIASLEAGEHSLVLYLYRDLSKATKNFSEKLGGGSFGSVFKGVLPNSTPIAVKRLEGFGQGDKQFRSEVSTIGMIQHVNLLRLRGFCSEGPKKLLVYDYMKNGSLDAHLFHPKGDEILDWKRRFQIAVGTARGLAYLHEECRDCIIHCDIKPENILLDADFQPKVADFGMAKLVGREFSRVLTTMRGTIGYLAPEWVSGSAITPKADVYSYGMMLLEIISERRNANKFEEGDVSYFPVWAAAKLNEGEVLTLLDQRLEGNANLDELTRACRIACWCIQDDEADRPTMGQVVRILEGALEVNIPPIPRLLLNLMADEGQISSWAICAVDTLGFTS